MHTVLTACEGEHIPFDWSVNPYRGCAFACRYCYARYTHEWLGKDPDVGFDKEIVLKEDIDRVLCRDLVRLRHRKLNERRGAAKRGVAPSGDVEGGEFGSRGQRIDLASGSFSRRPMPPTAANRAAESQPMERVAIGTATDPYQPLEHKYGLTRECLKAFLREPSHHPDGYDLSVTTKSDLVVRDIPLLEELSRKNRVTINMTLTTLDEDLLRDLECGAPTARARLTTMKTLRAAGLDVCAFVSPILPGITDEEEALEALFSELAEAGVQRVVCEALFLRSPSKEVFFRFLEEKFPERLEEYQRRYHSSAYASPLYVERLRARVERLRDRFGLCGKRPSHAQSLGVVDAGARRKQLPKRPLPRGSGLQQLFLFES